MSALKRFHVLKVEAQTENFMLSKAELLSRVFNIPYWYRYTIRRIGTPDHIDQIWDALNKMGHPHAIWQHKESRCVVFQDENMKIGVPIADLCSSSDASIDPIVTLVEGLERKFATWP